MRKTWILIIFCIAGVLLNRVFNTLLLITGVPLYFDTVATISVTLLAGPIWGCITGALTNFVTPSTYGWTFYLFALCNIATALITWFFIKLFPKELDFNFIPKITATKTYLASRRFDNVMDFVIVLVLLSFALCIAMSILGGLISFIVGWLKNESNPSTAALSMMSDNTPLVIQEILSRIPVNIVDRLISAFGGFGIAVMARKNSSFTHKNCPKGDSNSYTTKGTST